MKLSAVAERDPLSAMGIIQIAAKDPEAEGRRKRSGAQTLLLNDNRAGFVSERYTRRAARLDTLTVEVQVSDEGNSIKADLDKFPKQWFSFLDSPRGFYRSPARRNEGIPSV